MHHRSHEQRVGEVFIHPGGSASTGVCFLEGLHLGGGESASKVFASKGVCIEGGLQPGGGSASRGGGKGEGVCI